MHEFSVARSLLDEARQAAMDAGATHVRELRCRIGVLRQIDDELLREAFRAVAEQTICDGAELNIETRRMRAFCPKCEKTFEIVGWGWMCGECGTEGERPAGGDELELMSIEAEAP